MKVPDKKHWSKEVYLIRNYLDFYNEVIKYSKDNSLPLSQRCYNFINSIQDLPICEVCNKKPVSFYSTGVGYKQYCSKKCSANSPSTRLKRENTNLKLYGSKNISGNEEIKKKKKETCFKNNGVDIPFKKKEIRDKYKSTCEKKYGSDNFFKTDLFKKKYEKTCMIKYGVKSHNSSEETQQKKINTLIKRYGVSNPKYLAKFTNTSKIELKLKEKFNGVDFIFNNRKYDFKIDNDIFEIDGDYFHCSELKNLRLFQIYSAINDFNKDNDIKKTDYNLYRILVSSLPKNIDNLTLEELKALHYKKDYSLLYKQVIIDKDYLKQYREKKGDIKLLSKIKTLVKFIRKFQTTFPYPPREESIFDIMKKIQKYDLSRIYNNDDKSFSNKSNNHGTMFLKSIFKNYWESSFKGGLSPYEAFFDDKTLSEIIKYRIGLNSSGEVFDFSLHQIIRGISARRISISFFKPTVAAAIYKYFLGDKESPIVIDPCAGFGGRLLGFKSIYPEGKYIGIEPNPETFKYLQELVKIGDFKNVELHNCKLEEYQGSFNCDLSFTSIPYFDLEDYNGINFDYKNLDDWNKNFISGLLNFKNLVVNLPSELQNKINLNYKDKFYLKNQTSHFNNSDSKKELILVL